MELWQAPIWSSAYRHGDTDDQIRHALRHIVAFADDPDPDVTLFLGAADDTGTLLEVGVLDTDNGPVVIHAMKPGPDRIARRFGPRED